MTKLINFYHATTVRFSVAITLDGAPVDITLDAVTLYIKRGDEADIDAPIRKAADVTTGTPGLAVFALSPEETAVDPGSYTAEIVWERSNGDVYVVYHYPIDVRPRLTGV